MSESISGHRRRLRNWRRSNAQRDALIIAAFAAGMSVIQIHEEMGVSRQHIYELLRREHPEWLEAQSRKTTEAQRAS